LTREFIFGAIRSAIQIGAGIGGWFLWLRFGVIGGVVAVLIVLLACVALAVVRGKRFKNLFAERLEWIREDKLRRVYLPFTVLVIIGFVILSVDLYFRTDFKWVMYVQLLGISLWDEVWLAHRRYQAD